MEDESSVGSQTQPAGGEEPYQTDFTMSDAGLDDVRAALLSPDALPFFVEEVKGSDWYASIQKPTRIVGWARDVVPEAYLQRVPAMPAQVTIESEPDTHTDPTR